VIHADVAFFDPVPPHDSICAANLHSLSSANAPAVRMSTYARQQPARQSQPARLVIYVRGGWEDEPSQSCQSASRYRMTPPLSTHARAIAAPPLRIHARIHEAFPNPAAAAGKPCLSGELPADADAAASRHAAGTQPARPCRVAQKTLMLRPALTPPSRNTASRNGMIYFSGNEGGSLLYISPVEPPTDSAPIASEGTTYISTGT